MKTEDELQVTISTNITNDNEEDNGDMTRTSSSVASKGATLGSSTDSADKPMIVSLKEYKSYAKEDDDDQHLVQLVGGKGGSLMKLYSIPEVSHYVPQGYVLTINFFEEWINQVIESQEYQQAISKLSSFETTSPSTTNNNNMAELVKDCNQIKKYCHQKLELSQEQQEIISNISKDMKTNWNLPLAAVRSSAPKEDGSGTSFAGVFETRLGIPSNLEELTNAVKACLASLFDYRVFSYMMQMQTTSTSSGVDNHNKPEIAVVVMEMVDSVTAGVAFSVNPINSDLDELVVDCSYGLGESVVDGSIVADRYIYNKLSQNLIETTLGSKEQEKRLNLESGGQIVKPVSKQRQRTRCLSDSQLGHLNQLVCIIEDVYGIPMDIEFAYTAANTGTTATNNVGNDDENTEQPQLQLRLLQARPITTLYELDKELLTLPGEPRRLYYDFNVASEATTTEPFTHLDLDLYNNMCSALFGIPGINIFPYVTNNQNSVDDLMVFTASTRQYMNLNVVFPWVSTKTFAHYMEMVRFFVVCMVCECVCVCVCMMSDRRISNDGSLACILYS